MSNRHIIEAHMGKMLWHSLEGQYVVVKKFVTKYAVEVESFGGKNIYTCPCHELTIINKCVLEKEIKKLAKKKELLESVQKALLDYEKAV